MDEQRRTEQKERLEFRGGWGMSFLPAVIFLFFVSCTLLFLRPLRCMHWQWEHLWGCWPAGSL